MGLKLFSREKKKKKKKKSEEKPAASSPERTPARSAEEFDAAPLEPLDSDQLRAMFQQGRFNLILRESEQWTSHPAGRAIMEEAAKRLEDQVAIVPAGEISMTASLSSAPGDPEDEIDVPPFLMDICCVTHAQFQRFVDAGAYDDLDLWPEDIWPHIIEMHDLTGAPAPRYWRDGRHDRRLANHPVVGICWYEAQAFAAWLGKRLPTEAEWQMATSWHVKSNADVLRRFPWGDAMNTDRCNIWLSGVGATVPVDAYPNGAAPNHVLQLIGNVWEWTGSDFSILDYGGAPIFGEMPMFSIRGGAFDTYYEGQATSQFRTGQIALARTHNLGLRCAMDLDDAVWMNA